MTQGSGAWPFPAGEEDNRIIRGMHNGQPFELELGNFPPDEPTFLDKINWLWRGKKEVCFAKIHSHLGGDFYRILKHFREKSVSGQLLRARWLKPRSYDPPMSTGSWVVVRKDVDGRYCFVGKSTEANLGDIKAMFSSTVPTGWLLCNKANHDAGAVNGITPPNLEGRFIVATGEAANQTLNTNDTGYDYSLGDEDGYNDHGVLANNHTDHEHLAGHTHPGTTNTEGSHTHLLEGVETTTVEVDNNLDAVTTMVVNGGTTAGGTSHVHGFTSGASSMILNEWDEKHGATDNRPPHYALAFIIFVGV